MKILMLLACVAFSASQSIATEKATAGDPSPPFVIDVQSDAAECIQALDFKLQAQSPLVALVPAATLSIEVEKSIHTFGIVADQKGGSSHAYGYWKVNRCKNSK